jgi:hypothetical protein
LIAGLLIAETDYRGEVETVVEPFKGLALGVFLISIGMQIDIGFIVVQLGQAGCCGCRRSCHQRLCRRQPFEICRSSARRGNRNRPC